MIMDKEDFCNNLINKGELLASSLISQVAKQIKIFKGKTDFDVTLSSDYSIDVLRIACLILKNSGWMAKREGDNKLVLTPFDPYDPDRIFILRGADRRDLEEARRPGGTIPKVPNYSDLSKEDGNISF